MNIKKNSYRETFIIFKASVSFDAKNNIRHSQILSIKLKIINNLTTINVQINSAKKIRFIL